METMKKMEKPNIYKARIGAMDITAKELTYLMRKRGMKIREPEISVAIHGGRQAKHARIRNEICLIYEEWKKEILKAYKTDFSTIL